MVTVDWFNVRATAATVYNLATMQLLLGFIVSYYIVESTDIYSYATTIDQSNDDDVKIRCFYLGAFLSTVPATYLSRVLGIRWTILVTSLSFAGLLPIVSVVQESSNERSVYLFLLSLSGLLFGFAQIAIMQGACMVEVIGQFCRMGSFYCFKEVCTILGLLAGTKLAASIGHPGAFPSLHTFSISLAIVVVSSLATFACMYNRVQELGVRDRVVSWSVRRESSMRTSLLLQQDGYDSGGGGLLSDDFGGKGSIVGVGGGGRLLHAPLDDSSGSSGGGGGASFRSYRISSFGGSPKGAVGEIVACIRGDMRWLLMQLRRPEVRALVAVTFIATLAIDTLEYWAFSYFQQALGASGDARQWGVLAARVSLCLGFAASDIVRPRFALRQWRIVVACTAGAALGVVLFLSAAGASRTENGASSDGTVTPALGLATTGAAFLGLFLAPLLPMCISVSYTLPDMTPGTGVAALLGVGYLSHVLASSLIGAIASSAGVTAAMLVLLSVLLLPLLGGSLPTALCLLIDVDAFHLPTPQGVVMAGESTQRESYGWT